MIKVGGNTLVLAECTLWGDRGRFGNEFEVP
jgi:hypothetical protein